MERRLVEFMDTSILLSLLNVPGKATDHGGVVKELQQKATAGVTLILPTAAIIETGNHVCGLKEGRERRTSAQNFDRLLRLSIEMETPWALHRATWDETLLSYMLAGVDTGMTLLQHAEGRRLGAGDLSILAERKLYQQNVSSKVVRVEIWTIDEALGQDSQRST